VWSWVVGHRGLSLVASEQFASQFYHYYNWRDSGVEFSRCGGQTAQIRARQIRDAKIDAAQIRNVFALATTQIPVRQSFSATKQQM
jgi:hypothetical protein